MRQLASYIILTIVTIVVIIISIIIIITPSSSSSSSPSWWWSGVVVSALASINEVNQHRARLVLRLVTVSGFNSWCGIFISVCGQPPRSTQPGHPFVGRHNEYQPKAGDALRLGSKGRCGWVAGKTV